MSVSVDGLTETLKAVQGLEADLRREANGELRRAAGECAGQLVSQLHGAAASGPPVARRVAASIRVKSDRLPVVSIGGNRRVGATGAPASVLVWGSEHGGHNFAAPAGHPGYWIRPTVARFKESGAINTYKRAVVQIMRKWRLL